MTTPYLRFPTLHGDRLGFVAEDDVWLARLDAGADGCVEAGVATRLTADRAPAGHTRFSPDGRHLAYTSRRDGAPEVTVVDLDGGAPRRLTWWGDPFTRVIGWESPDRVLAITAAGQPFRSRTWAHAVPLDGGAPERLPWGPLTGVARAQGRPTVLGVNQSRRSAASWKRYRGGTAGALWWDPSGSGEFEPLLAELAGQLEDPQWVGDRLVLLSDHEGWGNVYSVAADGTDLRRHTDHGDRYARAAGGDGRRVVYQALGELWLLDDLAADSVPRRIALALGGGGALRRPQPVPTAEVLGELAPDRSGRASAAEVHGAVYWLAHRDGPGQAVADRPGVRARHPVVLTDPEPAQGGRVRLAWVSDVAGDDALELATVEPADAAGPPSVLVDGGIGRVLELVGSPDGRWLGAACHDGRVLLVDTGDGTVHPVDAGSHGDASGLAFSPDSAWLAWSHPGPEPLRQIRLARTEGDRTPVEATELRFTDTEPEFTPDGRHLAFLSARTFDPVYDQLVFGMSFPVAVRPHLLPLAADTPSPFDPTRTGRPVGPAPAPASGSPEAADGDAAAAVTVRVDVEGLSQRAVGVPVPAARCRDLIATPDALVWIEDPFTGELGETAAPGRPPRGRLQRYDLVQRKVTTLVDGLDAAWPSGDGRQLVVRDGESVRVVPADRPASGPDDDAVVQVDLSRIRHTVDPAATWRQMFEENGRLMADHFWIADMSGVDWAAALQRYRPVVDRLGSRDDLSELLWEVLGELGTSHAYEQPPDRAADRARRPGWLGVEGEPADGGWRITRVLPGEPSQRAARSPLAAAGSGLRAGDVLVAVDGRPVDPRHGPGPALLGAADLPVELTARRGGELLHATVVPLPDERPLRYHAWVADRRALTHELSGGRVGYLHLPDMMAPGWAELHRDLHLELGREALVVDVRDNGGGHISQLVLERLSRVIQGWAVVRHRSPESYPTPAPRGPLVAIADQWAGSDGDIVTAGFQRLGLGPVVGQRTWGGVVGIDGRYHLVDGTLVTQPRYAFWFTGHGWEIENRGVEPDVAVPIAPQDWARGDDPQLARAVELAQTALAEHRPLPVPDPATRPDRAAPVLPPRR